MSAESPIVDLASQRAQRRTDRRAALRSGQVASSRSAVVHVFPAPGPSGGSDPGLAAGPGPASPFGPVMAFGLRADAEPSSVRPVADEVRRRRSLPRGAGRGPVR